MSMIDRVAKAIFHARFGNCVGERWEATSDADRRSHIDMARAAIEAMREPTPEIQACFDKYVDEAPLWGELIDVALGLPA